MAEKKTGFPALVYKHRIGLGCFVFLALYHWLYINNGHFWSVNPVTYSLYAMDYSMGFCSRILPGAVYHALIGKYAYAPVSAFVTVFFLLLLGLLSFLMERFFAAAPADEKKTCLILMFFFLTGPFTFGILTREFGLLDLYWVLLFAAAFPLLTKPRLKWLLPVFIVGMIFIHFAALFCYAATILSLLLFFAAKAEKKSEKREYLILFLLCFAVTVGLSGYFIQFESDNAVYPVETFNEILRSRGVVYPEYLDSTLYRITDSSIFTPVRELERFSPVDPSAPGPLRFIQWILYYSWGAFSFSQKYGRLWFLFLLEIPIAGFLLFLLTSYFRKVKGQGAKRFWVVLSVLLFFGTAAAGFLFSSDNFRWIAHAAIGLFISVFTVLRYDYPEGFGKARALMGKIGVPAVSVYALVYALVSMDPYS